MELGEGKHVSLLDKLKFRNIVANTQSWNPVPLNEIFAPKKYVRSIISVYASAISFVQFFQKLLFVRKLPFGPFRQNHFWNMQSQKKR